MKTFIYIDDESSLKTDAENYGEALAKIFKYKNYSSDKKETALMRSLKKCDTIEDALELMTAINSGYDILYFGEAINAAINDLTVVK